MRKNNAEGKKTVEGRCESKNKKKRAEQSQGEGKWEGKLAACRGGNINFIL